MRVSVCNRNEYLLEKLQRCEEAYARKTGGFTKDMRGKDDRRAVEDYLKQDTYDLLLIQIDLRKKQNLEYLKKWVEAKEHCDRKQRCVWTFNREIITLVPDEIYYFETYKRKTYVHTRTASYRISTTLKAEEDRFSDNGFIRVHQGYLVKADRIRKVEHHQIFLDNGSMVPVSVRKEREVASRLLKRIQEK